MFERLRKVQDAFEPKPQRDPVDELVMTVLSQHTSDTNTERAYAALRNRFASWDEVIAAPVDAVADAIRTGGLADQKAPRIKAILQEISAREGRVDLGCLRDMADDEVDAYLCSLPGVGPKTAACVLCFSLGRPAFPVDTHVHRIALRLGWIEPGTSADKAHYSLTPRIPPDIRYGLHMALIRHGREICKARSPRCSGCALFDLCVAGPLLLAAGEAV